MAELLSTIGTVFTQLIAWVPNVLTVVTSNDILMLLFSMSVIAFVIGTAVHFLKTL